MSDDLPPLDFVKEVGHEGPHHPVVLHEVDSGEHALVVGLAMGALMQAGLNVLPEMDGEGNYLASLVLTLAEPYKGKRVRLIVEDMP